MKTTLISIIMVCTISLCIHAQLPTNGLIGHWPFSGNALDNIGNNDGIVNGATLTNDRFGISNRAYYFDGIDDNISLLFDNAINLNTTTTIMLWFKAEEVLNSYAKLLCVPYSLNSWSNPYHYLAFSGPAFNYANFDPTNGMCDTEPFTDFVDTIWNLLTFTYDQGDIKIYINSELKETLTCSNIIMPENGTMSIGSRSTSATNNGEYFTGIIDDISFYNRVLTQDEISNYYNPTCIVSNTQEISTYYISDKNFKEVNNQTYFDSTVTKVTDLGCDSIITYYSKFIYTENYYTDSIAVTDTLIIDVAFSGTNEFETVNTIKVYPNPTNDIIYINTGIDYEQITDYKIKIVNNIGSVVFESTLKEKLYSINIKQFGQTGLYYVQIINDADIIIDTRKIILN